MVMRLGSDGRWYDTKTGQPDTRQISRLAEAVAAGQAPAYKTPSISTLRTLEAVTGDSSIQSFAQAEALGYNFDSHNMRGAPKAKATVRKEEAVAESLDRAHRGIEWNGLHEEFQKNPHGITFVDDVDGRPVAYRREEAPNNLPEEGAAGLPIEDEPPVQPEITFTQLQMRAKQKAMMSGGLY